MTTVDRYSPWIKAVQYVPSLQDRIEQSLKIADMAADHLLERIDMDRQDRPGVDRVEELLQISSHIMEPCLSPFYSDIAHSLKLVAVLAQRLANHHRADWIDSIPHEALSDLLTLVCVTRSPAEIAEWSREQRHAAYEWAAATHLHASDNTDVQVPERPDFLTDKEDES